MRNGPVAGHCNKNDSPSTYRREGGGRGSQKSTDDGRELHGVDCLEMDQVVMHSVATGPERSHEEPLQAWSQQ